MYDEIYQMCRNIEKVMQMFSKKLWELNQNTVKYMIDEMQAEIDQTHQELNDAKQICRYIEGKDQKLAENDQ